jgi:DNA-binding NarL/FixJ family response regulator
MINVVLAEMPRLLTAVVRTAVEAEQDMAIVAQVERPETLRAALANPVDVIITSAPIGEAPSPYRETLFGSRAIPLIAVSADGTSIDVYGHWIAHGSGLDGLITLIRKAVSHSHGQPGS